MPKVSIIMSVFNEDEYIKECIDSVLGQTFFDFEFIIVDDFSTDKTLGIIRSYAKQDSRIKIIENRKNKGNPYENLNIGIGQSHGEYISIIDGDDVWCDDDKIKKQVDFLGSNLNVGLVGTQSIFINENGETLFCHIVPVDNAKIKKRLAIINPFVHSSVMFRRNVVGKIGLYHNFFGKFDFAQDFCLWLRIGEVCDVANLSDVCVLYRIKEKGITHRNFFKQKMATFLLSFKFRKTYPNAYIGIFLNAILVFCPARLMVFLRKSKTGLYLKRLLFGLNT